MITVSTTINKPLELVWDALTKPEHITKWSFASDDWEAPYAEQDLREGGRFMTRMQAKDGSAGFDFPGTYTMVEPLKGYEYTMDDGRTCVVTLKETPEGTHVEESFDPESSHTHERQREGWQAFLNNLKKYVESL